MPGKKTPPAKDLYGILEVVPRARPKVIEAAYKALMTDHHPDGGHSGRVARDLNEAHDILSDPDKRKEYDEDRNKLAGTIVGQYHILEEIAEGGFGVTYKAEHIQIHEPVCVKHCLHVSPQDEELLVREAKAAWDLRHYSIPAMRDLIKLDDGSVALVMSFIEGKTLEQIVEKVGKLDPEHVAWISQRILNVLSYLHDKGVVHGDLKPQNIMVQPKSHQVVVVDFGLAAVKPTRTSTSTGYTPFYAPPEEEVGKPLVPGSDFYSLGMTMIYALSGSHDAVRQKNVPDDTPDALCDFIKKLIVRDVLHRPRRAYPLFEEIQEVREKAFGRKESSMKPLPGVD